MRVYWVNEWPSRGIGVSVVQLTIGRWSVYAAVAGFGVEVTW